MNKDNRDICYCFITPYFHGLSIILAIIVLSAYIPRSYCFFAIFIPFLKSSDSQIILIVE